ncbi:MAG: mechanosensitive ion channel [Prevotella sp.]|nr:mechanosensitive ion channel [Prevotella sp.]
MKKINKLTKYIILVVACLIIPAFVVWDFLPTVLNDYPRVYEAIRRLTAIYMTGMATWLLISFANTFRQIGEQHALPHQQYVNSFISVLKIVILFFAAIILVAVILDKDPSTLFAGLGAASAILMLAFQDTIKGLVAGIRLTSNKMLAVGDRITVPSAGADGIVEEMMLTTVKVRNFDNTIVTISPQTLVDGSFQNWKGMKEKTGRKVVRKVFFDYRSITIDAEGTVNLTRFREHMEQWLSQHPDVMTDNIIMVHQLDGTPAGLPVELVFWLKMQDVLPYEHAISQIMEHVYAEAPAFGLTVYQQFPQQ